MNKTRRLFLAVFLLAMTGVVLWEGLRQPWYRWRPLSAWLDDYGAGPRNYQASPGADEALRHIGPKAVPHLLTLLRATNAPDVAKLIPAPASNLSTWPKRPTSKSSFARLVEKHTPIRFPEFRHDPVPASWKHWKAYVGFQKLGLLGKAAICDLVELARDPGGNSHFGNVQGMTNIEMMAKLADNSGSYLAPYDSSFLGPEPVMNPRRLTFYSRRLRGTNSFLVDGEIAAWSLAAIGADAVPSLMELLEEPNPRLKQRATGALGLVGAAAEPAVPALVKNLKSPDRDVRMLAADALGWIGKRPDLAVPALIEALKDSDIGVGIYAAESLGRFGDRATNAIPALLENFAARDYRIRQSAAVALSRISPETTAKEVIPVLLRDLQDSRPNFRNSAMINLSQMHMLPDMLIPAFITALDDSDNTVRMNAIHALDWFGAQSKAAVPKLVSLTTDQNPFVREYVTNALGKIEPAWRIGR